MLRIDSARFELLRNCVVLAIMPAFFSLLFGLVYAPTYVYDIPLAIMDRDGSAISRQITDSFADNPGFEIVMWAEDQAAIEDALLQGTIAAALIIPDDFARQLSVERSASPLFLIDGCNLVVANNANSHAGSIFNTLNVAVQIKYLQAGDTSPYEVEQQVNVLSFVDRTLYDPTLSYFQFTFAGLLGVYVQQTLLIVMTVLFLRAGRQRRFPSPLAVLPYYILNLVGALLAMVLVRHFFNYPLQGDLGLSLLLQVMLLLDLTAVALILASLFRDEAHCVQFIMFLAIPTLFTSGYIWPAFSMPAGFAWLVRLFWPLGLYNNSLHAVQMKGAGFGDVGVCLLAMAAYALIWLPLAIALFRRRNGLSA